MFLVRSLGVQSSGFRVWLLGLRVWGFRVYGLRFGCSSLGSRAKGSNVRCMLEFWGSCNWVLREGSKYLRARGILVSYKGMLPGELCYLYIS